MPKIHPPIGFHGDKYLLCLVDFLAKRVNYFVETGTNIGASLHYFAKRYPKITCRSCELSKPQCKRAIENTRSLANVNIINTGSVEFLHTLPKEILQSPTLFWLDAHGRGFKWPLLEEIEFVTTRCTNAYILIDDFKIPGKKQFQFDRYNGQFCSYAYIAPKIGKRPFSLYYPAYTEHTSKYHPLVGWGLIDISKTVDTDLSQTIKFIQRADVEEYYSRVQEFLD